MRGRVGQIALVGVLAAGTVVLASQQAATVPEQAAPQATQSPANAPRRPLAIEDVAAWRTIGATAISDDGKWFAYRIGPGEGDAQVVVRQIGSDRELTFEAGDPQAGQSGAATPPAAGLDFSDDGRWLAFATNPSRTESLRLRRQRRPVQSGVTLVNLTTGEKQDYPKIRKFEFSNGTSTHIALQRHPAQTAPGGGQAAAGGGEGGGASDRPKGTDLLLRELASGRELNVGNVADFVFSHDGRRLALTIDAQDKAGNGLQVRDLATGAVQVLDSGDATYARPTWTKKDDGLAVLKGTDDRLLRDKRYAVLGFTKLETATPSATVFDPQKDVTFPKDMSVSPDRDPKWTADLSTLIFGIHTVRPKDGGDGDTRQGEAGGDDNRPAGNGDPTAADRKVDLVLWHWKDPRLQTQQEVQESRDRAFSYLAAYRPDGQKFMRLADDDLRTVDVAPGDRWAIGFDDREYELTGNLDGRRYRDAYVVDLRTGERRLAVRRVRWYTGPSPDGSAFLYYDDGEFRVYSMDSGQSRSITAGAPVSFVDVEDDHNVVKPPTDVFDWTSDSKAVLISDGWDIWRVPVTGGAFTNLTVNGRKDAVRYQRRFRTERPEDQDKGIDLSAPQFFSSYGEWTKKGGIVRLDPGKTAVTSVAWDDASFSRLLKAAGADVVVYSRETALEAPDFFATDAGFAKSARLTDQRPQTARFEWTPGVRLVSYTSEKGDRLQAALFLPAGYEPGKSYPTVVNFYERMSQTANTFTTPTTNGFSRPLYTSQGYAVLIPDIAYKVNDPGMSAVWCMVPAVKAAIATGIVDPAHVGITGHSWGGYQTSFLVTQTDIFAAAVAGAPLTNLVSMYSLIYKNTGGTNQPIFESSQGRFRGGYWDNWDAYYRNSPVFFAKNVKTPLMILHNDKDGAVDFTQGVEYYNTLRRLQKPVIMLEYLGENHGLRKPANQRDYTARMLEYFDHYLNGRPAPAWMINGVPRLQMEEHLKERAKPQKTETQREGDPQF